MQDLTSAYRHCERVTRRRAANFFYGIRLLPPAKRRAMCAAYAFAREVDDIGDGTMSPEQKLAALDELQGRLHGSNGHEPTPMMVALGDATQRFQLPVDAFDDLIAGVRTDIYPARFDTFDETVIYCRRVAGSIGRLCLAIFGSTDPERAYVLADDLGVAMQLTNILRDVREDALGGRVYLPREDLVRFDCPNFPEGSPEALSALVSFQAGRAREWFDRGLELVPLLDTRSASCVLAMTGIYRRLLERIEESPGLVMERRVSLPGWEKAWVAARSLMEAAA
ncbi:MAG TPA: squalene/phytoene synthase family protein [Thermoleophilaceae bacterium]